MSHLKQLMNYFESQVETKLNELLMLKKTDA